MPGSRALGSRWQNPSSAGSDLGIPAAPGSGSRSQPRLVPQAQGDFDFPVPICPGCWLAAYPPSLPSAAGESFPACALSHRTRTSTGTAWRAAAAPQTRQLFCELFSTAAAAVSGGSAGRSGSTAPGQHGEGLNNGCITYGSCPMHHPGCGTHGATQNIGWRFPAMAEGQPGMHQGGFPLVPHHPLGSSPMQWVVFEGAGSSITPMDTFSQLPALRGDFKQCGTQGAQS